MAPLNKQIQFDRDIPLANALRSVINQANQQHASDRALALYAHRFAIQKNYWLTEESQTNREHNLVALIQHYVDYLPSLIEEFNRECNNVGWQTVGERTNQIIAAFFEKLENPLRQSGILGLLDKVYFAHRLIEEMHDHLMCVLGKPSISWDMTSTNLLMHQLLGSEYSSRLDQTAIELSEKLIEKAPDAPGQITPQKGAPSWPCFCAEHGFNFSF